MEIDFLGLSWEDSSSNMAKQKSNGICKDSVARVQWPFASMVSSPHQQQPFQATQEDKQEHFFSDPLDSVFLPVSSGFAFDFKSKSPGFSKRDKWTLPLKDKMVSGGSNNHLLDKIAVTNQINFSSATLKQPPPGKILVTRPVCKAPTYLRNNAKHSGRPASLTIFYSDAVHVYHDISPDKVKAIMCMAGNGSSITVNTKQISKPVAEDIRSRQPRPPNAVYSTQNAFENFIAGTLPMARKATLARFLEKRKNRFTEFRPYNVIEKSLDLNRSPEAI